MRVGPPAEEGNIPLAPPWVAVALAARANVLDRPQAIGVRIVTCWVEDVRPLTSLLRDAQQRQHGAIGEEGSAVIVGLDDELEVGDRLSLIVKLVHQRVYLVQHRQQHVIRVNDGLSV